jgi:hypothetical protein
MVVHFDQWPLKAGEYGQVRLEKMVSVRMALNLWHCTGEQTDRADLYRPVRSMSVRKYYRFQRPPRMPLLVWPLCPKAGPVVVRLIIAGTWVCIRL